MDVPRVSVSPILRLGARRPVASLRNRQSQIGRRSVSARGSRLAVSPSRLAPSGALAAPLVASCLQALAGSELYRCCRT